MDLGSNRFPFRPPTPPQARPPPQPPCPPPHQPTRKPTAPEHPTCIDCTLPLAYIEGIPCAITLACRHSICYECLDEITTAVAAFDARPDLPHPAVACNWCTICHPTEQPHPQPTTPPPATPPSSPKRPPTTPATTAAAPDHRARRAQPSSPPPPPQLSTPPPSPPTSPPLSEADSQPSSDEDAPAAPDHPPEHHAFPLALHAAINALPEFAALDLTAHAGGWQHSPEPTAPPNRTETPTCSSPNPPRPQPPTNRKSGV